MGKIVRPVFAVMLDQPTNSVLALPSRIVFLEKLVFGVEDLFVEGAVHEGRFNYLRLSKLIA